MFMPHLHPFVCRWALRLWTWRCGSLSETVVPFPSVIHPAVERLDHIVAVFNFLRNNFE